MGPGRRIRVLMAKPGLDGHDRGVKVVIQGLRDAGMEVIYTGLRRTVDQIVAAATQENVDVIGLSILSGAYMGVARKLMARVKEEGLGGVLVIMGGNILEKHIPELKAIGVAEVFRHHADLGEIARFIRGRVQGAAAR
ncbi:MAG: cobalamin B12-binding domain-containing protein [Candidatus Tectomicrobia bacterium]|nr:cobalamin B12-binding domain-containing protein [Candidatus Tectomicrobia bacterium]